MENYLDNWLNKSQDERKKIFQDESISLKYDVKKYLEENPSNFKLLVDLYKGIDFIQKDTPPYIVGKIIELTSEINRYLINHPESNKKTKFYNDLLKEKIPEFIRFLYCDVNDDLINKENYLSLLLEASNGLFDSTILENALKISTEQYSDEWHFFFELIQNSRDSKSNKISMEKLKFDENRSFLIYANDGDKFNPMDVWGITSLGQGAKNRSENIGYFGIGFKSVSLVTNSVIIISKPLHFRLNFNYGDIRKKYIEWNFGGDSCWNFIQKKRILSKYSNFTNIFILENINNTKFNDFFKHTKNIDPNFMLFLTPLKKASILDSKLNSDIVTDFFNLTKEEYENELYNTQIVKIEESTYIIHTLFEDLNLKDDNHKEIGKREVKIAFNIKKISNELFKVKKNKSKFDLYAYFPVSNNNPGFQFIFHAHFLLTNSRADLVINAKHEWKNDLNHILINDKGVKCFLELYKQLANLKVSVKNLTNVFPFKNVAEDKNLNEEYAYKNFQEGLIKYLKNDYNRIPFWWDEEGLKYISFSDVIFIQDKQASKVLKFLQINIKSSFNSCLNGFSELNFNDDIYICEDNDKITFCKAVFDDFDIRFFDSKKCYNLIKTILSSIDSAFESDFILVDEWEGYFNSIKILEEFRRHLMEWDYFNKTPKDKLSECFLIILEDCEGDQYYARVKYGNYYYIEQELFKNYEEIFELLQEIDSKFPRIELPLFIPEMYEEEYKDKTNLFYQCDSFNIYSIFNISDFSKIAVENEVVLNLYINLISKIFRNLLDKIESLEEFNRLFKLFSGNDSRNYRESKIFYELIYNLLEQPIFPGSLKNDNFFDLFWGNTRYLEIFANTPVSKSFNILKSDLYNFSELIMNIIGKSVNYKEFSDYRDRINYNNLSFNSVKDNIDEVKELVNNRTIDHLKEQFDSRNHIISFFTNEHIFNDFFKCFYLNDYDIKDLRYVIHLSKIFKPSRFQILEIKNDFRNFPIIELQEDLSETDFESIKDLYISIKGKKHNWIHREDLIQFKRDSKIKVKKKSVFNLLQSIIKKLNKSDNKEHWINFYEFVLKYYSNLETQQQSHFKNQYRDYFKEEKLVLKFINLDGDLIDSGKIYPDIRFEIYPFLFEQIVSYPSFQKYRINTELRDLWNDLENAGLIFTKSDTKIFLRQVLSTINNLKTFYEDLTPKADTRENLTFIQFYEKFMKILQNSGFTLGNLRNYKLIPTLTFEFLKVNDLSQAINFLYFDDGLQSYPFEEVNEKFLEFKEYSKLFNNWIAPAYYKYFEEVFREDLKASSLKPLGIKDWLLKPDIIKEERIKQLPIFLNLTLLEYYFKYRERFEIEQDLPVLKNSLSFLIFSGIEKNILINFFEYLKELKDTTSTDIIDELRNILSEFEIYPYEIDGKWNITNLKNPNLDYSKNKIPDFFLNVLKKSDFIYLHQEIEKLLKNSELGFAFLKYGRPPNLELVLKKFKHLFNPNNKNFNLAEHKTLVNFIFQSKNFNFYDSQEKKLDLKKLIENLYLKGINGEFQLSSNLLHPLFYKNTFISWWKDLTSIDSKDLKNSNIINTIDFEFYDLENFPFNNSKKIEDILIFEDTFNRIDGLNIILNILHQLKENIKDFKKLIDSFCKNLSHYFNHFYFKKKDEINIEELTEISLLILEFLYQIYRAKEPNYFNKYLLTDEQFRQCRVLFDDESAFTINNAENFKSLREMINSNQDFINLDVVSMFNFFENKKIFNTIQNSLTLEKIEKKIFEIEDHERQIIEALSHLFSENQFYKLFYSQKSSECKTHYFNILNKNWIKIGKISYPLKNLYLKNDDLEFNLDILKEYAYFDDFCLEKKIAIEDVSNFIDFFEIKALTLNNLVNHLIDLNSKPFENKAKILNLITHLTKKKFIKNIIEKIRQIKVIPVIDINNNLRYEFLSLDELIDLEYVFFSSKEFIVEEMLEEWKKSPEFQSNPVLLLFDKKNSTYLNSWKRILGKMLESIENGIQLTNIEEYPDPLIDKELIFEGEEPREKYTDEISFLREIFTFLKKESTDNTLKPLRLRDLELECLNKRYKIQRIPNITGVLPVPNFKGNYKQFSHVSISRFFKVQKNNIIQYNGLQKSDLRELFYRNLCENLFPIKDKNESQVKRELEVFNNIIKWYEDREDFMDKNGSVNSNKLRKYLIKFKNLDLKARTEEEKDSLNEFLELIQRSIDKLINIVNNTEENLSSSCSNAELLNLLNFIRNQLKIKDHNLKIPNTKVKIGLKEEWI